MKNKPNFNEKYSYNRITKIQNQNFIKNILKFPKIAKFKKLIKN